MSAVGRGKDAARGAYGPAQTIADKTDCIEARATAIAHDSALPGHAAVTGLQDRCASAGQPSVGVIEKGAAQQEMFSRRCLLGPMCAAIDSREHDTSFAKHPTAFSVSEDCAH